MRTQLHLISCVYYAGGLFNVRGTYHLVFYFTDPKMRTENSLLEQMFDLSTKIMNMNTIRHINFELYM